MRLGKSTDGDHADNPTDYGVYGLVYRIGVLLLRDKPNINNLDSLLKPTIKNNSPKG